MPRGNPSRVPPERTPQERERAREERDRRRTLASAPEPEAQQGRAPLPAPEPAPPAPEPAAETIPEPGHRPGAEGVGPPRAPLRGTPVRPHAGAPRRRVTRARVLALVTLAAAVAVVWFAVSLFQP